MKEGNNQRIVLRVKAYCFILWISLILHPSSLILAQNMPHEIGFWFAANGQLPLIKPDDANRGFFTNPAIEHLYYSFATDGVQSVSFFVEHVNETRPWNGTWTNYLYNDRYDTIPKASVGESLQMTTIGIETVRNLISESGLRVGGGIGVGFGLGGASASVRDTNGNQTSYSSATAWDALLVELLVRVRYSLIVTSSYDIGIMLQGRYWSFPAFGPVASGGSSYNGPALRAVSEVGYLAGVSIGF
jgi:hypothetical protein